MALEVNRVTKEFKVRGGSRSRKLVAVNDVSFILEPGKTIALVGESGSGKSTIAKMILRLDMPTKGTVTVDGTSSAVRGSTLTEYRHRVQMVFQDPFASLNPFHTIAHHIERPLRIHGKFSSSRELQSKVEELLSRVNLEPAADISRRRPHELSGGQRQRLVIASATAQRKRVYLLDEPTSGVGRDHLQGISTRLRRLAAAGAVVVVVTHDDELVDACADTVVHLPDLNRTAPESTVPHRAGTTRHRPGDRREGVDTR